MDDKQILTSLPQIKLSLPLSLSISLSLSVCVCVCVGMSQDTVLPVSFSLLDTVLPGMEHGLKADVKCQTTDMVFI